MVQKRYRRNCPYGRVDLRFVLWNSTAPGRRNLTKGQQAMGYAMVHEPEPGGRGKLTRNRENLSRTMENRVSQARSVLRYSHKLAEAVAAGVTPLNESVEP